MLFYSKLTSKQHFLSKAVVKSVTDVHISDLLLLVYAILSVISLRYVYVGVCQYYIIAFINKNFILA
jgi:hypothetical protein